MSIPIFIIFENSTKLPKMSENVWLTPQMCRYSKQPVPRVTLLSTSTISVKLPQREKQ